VALFGLNIHISRQTVFMESRIPYREKTTLPRATADVSEFVGVAAPDAEASSSVFQFGNINPTPFQR